MTTIDKVYTLLNMCLKIILWLIMKMILKPARNQSKYRDVWMALVGDLRPRTTGTYCHAKDTSAVPMFADRGTHWCGLSL